MKRITISVSAVLFIWLQAGAVSILKNGFVTWSEGDQAERTLQLRNIINGELGPVKKIVEKGDAGGDIEGVISFDGKWIAFSRKREATCVRVGGQYRIGMVEDDFNKFHCWSIYAARLDGALPATPIKVADEGYSPSWSDNSAGTEKTLFFGVWTKGEIWKAEISDAGNTVSMPVKHASIPGWSFGNHHLQCAPNGKLAGVEIKRNSKVIGLNGFDYDMTINRGENFSWFADSYWLFNARRWVGNINKGKAQGALAGHYHFGSAANMKWAITTMSRVGRSTNDNGFELQYADVTKTGDSLTIGEFNSPIISEKGSWPDIHEFEGIVPVHSGTSIHLSANFHIEQACGQLIVNTALSGRHAVELYDINGLKKASEVSHSSRTTLSVQGFPTGLYVLQVKYGHRAIRKKWMLH